MDVRFISKSDEYRYTLRRCSICLKFDECRGQVKWSHRFEWLEPARCGCTGFLSDNKEAMVEKPSRVNG